MLYFSAKQRRHKYLLRVMAVSIAVAVLAALYPFLRAACQQISCKIDAAFARHYAAELGTLRNQNASLRAQIARTAQTAEENDAFRALIDCERLDFSESYRWLTGYVSARWKSGMTLSGFEQYIPAVGDIVLDRYARFAGRIIQVVNDRAEVAFAGTDGCPTTGRLGTMFGLYSNHQLSGLPRDFELTEGLLVTEDGCWLGCLGSKSTLSPDGLTISCLLEDTADLEDWIYFVQQKITE